MAKMPTMEVRIRTIEARPVPWWAWVLIGLGVVALSVVGLWLHIAFIRWACR